MLHHFSILYISPNKMKHKLTSSCQCKELSGPSELGHIRRARFRCSRAAFVQIRIELHWINANFIKVSVTKKISTYTSFFPFLRKYSACLKQMTIYSVLCQFLLKGLNFYTSESGTKYCCLFYFKVVPKEKWVTYFNLAAIFNNNLFLFPLSPADFIGNVLPI